jgi:predicted amidophosphoribosyltransferase
MNSQVIPIEQEFFIGNGRIYACGTYYPRRHKLHWRHALSQAVWNCKHGNTECIKECGTLIARTIDAALPIEMVFVITYVPSEAAHSRSVRHSRSAAQGLASAAFETLRQHRDLTIERLIVSVRPKPRKQHLCASHHERRENVIGCFAATRTNLIHARHVVVIDDMVTSGATIRECHRVLLDAGAADVMGFVIARTVGWLEDWRSP